MIAPAFTRNEKRALPPGPYDRGRELVHARPQVILLPGAVLPADLAYGVLLEALGDEVEAVATELEIYAAEEPPLSYALDVEVDGLLRAAETCGFDRFHLVGYSGGGASSLAFAATHPERLRSLALLEPAWAGNDGLDRPRKRSGESSTGS
jgi:pimeloyl-ACP methyl ester carboxylesterase